MSKELLGTLYFTPTVDEETGQLRTKYEGKIVGFIVQRDSGAEFEVRAEHKVSKGDGLPLRMPDLKNVKVGDKLAYLDETVPSVEVVKVFPDHGDLWVRGIVSQKQTVKKYYDLKRVV